MKEANKTGSISKLKGNRRRPYVLYSPYFYDSVSQKYKRSTCTDPKKLDKLI